jgi:hypothetical protein
MIEGAPKEVDGWNVAELAGGLLLSTDDFMVQFNPAQVDNFLHILNSGRDGEVQDSKGDLIKISSPSRDHVVLTRAGDKTYPNGIILPVDVFSEVDDKKTPVIEDKRPVFRREGSKIKRAFQTTGTSKKITRDEDTTMRTRNTE